MSIKSLRRQLDEIYWDFAQIDSYARFDPQAETEANNEIWLQTLKNVANRLLEIGKINAWEAERMIKDQKCRLLPDPPRDLEFLKKLNKHRKNP